MKSRLDSLLGSYVETDGLSYSMLVAEGGEALYEGSCGVTGPESEEALTPRSSFNLASVTKLFTALCAMQLAERKLLELDADVRTWLPEALCEGVTVRHLLTHTCDSALEFLVREERQIGRRTERDVVLKKEGWR